MDVRYVTPFQGFWFLADPNPGRRCGLTALLALGWYVTVGKVEVMSLYLPVVAMGLIPHIYQRAGLALGYPYSGCHASWDNISCFTIFIFAFAELLQSQEPELQAEVFYADFPVVSIVLPLPLHGSQTHPRP